MYQHCRYRSIQSSTGGVEVNLSINKRNFEKERHKGSFYIFVFLRESNNYFHVISNLGDVS